MLRDFIHPVPAGLPGWHPAVLLATWFWSGRLRPASGSWGSLAALPFAWAIERVAGPWGLVVGAILVFAAGVWAAGRYAAADGVGDPSPVVIDEVVGQWLTLAVVPLTPITIVIGFFLFRLFDVLKPFPAGWADRTVKGGVGVMLDDVFAAGWAAAFLWGIDRWLI